MRNTIKAKVGYAIKKATHKITKANLLVLYDGDDMIMVATPRTYADYIDEKTGNEMFNLCEVFTTVKGSQYIYWRDEEIDEDYLTKVIH